MATVWIPAALRSQCGGTETVDIQAANLRQVVEGLERLFPGLRARLCAGDGLRPGIAAAIDGQVATLGLLQPVRPQSEVHFVLAVAGG
jgi:molybdopterin converting factor small subunit